MSNSMERSGADVARSGMAQRASVEAGAALEEQGGPTPPASPQTPQPPALKSKSGLQRLRPVADLLRPVKPPAPPEPPTVPYRSTSGVRSVARADVGSVIGTDLRIRGAGLCLESDGTLQIDGAFVGDVEADEVIVGRAASVTGTVRARRVIVEGGVAGDIEGGNVMLRPTATVTGDITHEALSVDAGATFEGAARRA